MNKTKEYKMSTTANLFLDKSGVGFNIDHDELFSLLYDYVERCPDKKEISQESKR